ncbi:amidase [Synechococcus sp. PCC 7335]|uniref:amidase n=1 Tax=Synechococcus sp. (strain ATCC 29403 / PCC 7335) TaxID=91464 RepID=UPI0012F753A2|nr:amidase family protein [Synechococcus sp. PCC 7335]
MRHLQTTESIIDSSTDVKQSEVKKSIDERSSRQTTRTLQKSLASATAKLFTLNLETATIADIHLAFEAKTLTVEQLVQLYLNRIETYDKQGPAINALISINPNALATARLLDQFMPQKLSSLYGIPIILKDNFNTIDLPTTGGSAVLANSIPPEDAVVVKRLKEAGAIILGKANMSEFALSAGRLGYSSQGGLTLNPYDLNRDASGSSSGSAAAIAANFAVFSTGSDTAGSIRGPASFTGLVGIKPTSGLISPKGVIPLAPSVEANGPIAKTVTDAAIGLGVMAGLSSNNSATLGSIAKPFKDYTQFLDVDALKGARIGIVRDFLSGNPEVDQIFQDALGTLSSLGATVVEVKLSSDGLAVDSYGHLLDSIIQSEFFPQIETYLQTLDDAYPKTLKALIEASLDSDLMSSNTPVNPNRIALYQASIETGGLSNSEYVAAIAQRLDLQDAVFSTFSLSNLDALVYPTVDGLPSLTKANNSNELKDSIFPHDFDSIKNDPYRVGYLANLTGFPDITVPAGFTQSALPVGLSFFAPAYSEPKLLGLAYAFEQATKVRRNPVNTPPLFGEAIGGE